MSYTVNIDSEEVDRIVLNELKTSRKAFISDLNSAVNPNIFFWDEPEKDKAEIQRHIDALNIVISWFDIPGDE